jgi:hypothetical protein
MSNIASAPSESVGDAIARRMTCQDASATEESVAVITRLSERARQLADVQWPTRVDLSRQLGAQQIEVAAAVRELSAAVQGPGSARMELVADQVEVKARRFLDYLPAAEVARSREGER